MSELKESLEAAAAKAAQKVAESDSLEEATGWQGILNQTSNQLTQLDENNDKDTLNLKE